MDIQALMNSPRLVAMRRVLDGVGKRISEVETEAEGWRLRAVALRDQIVGIRAIIPAIPAFKAPIDWWPAVGPAAQLDEALKFGDLAAGRAAGLRVEYDRLRRRIDSAVAEMEAIQARQWATIGLTPAPTPLPPELAQAAFGGRPESSPLGSIRSQRP